MSIVVGAGITIGPGIVVGEGVYIPPVDVFFITEDNLYNLVDQSDNQFIEE